MPASIVGALAVELGLDTAKFEQSLKGLPGVAGIHLNSMSAEMKRTSREGAESFRIVEEALGVHISRPISKILSETFPGFAKAFQSILGGAITGAIAIAAFEAVSSAVEKLTKKFEEAKKAQEEYEASARHLSETLQEVATAHEKRLLQLNAELAALSGNKQGELSDRIRIANIEDADLAIAQINKIAEAMERASKAAMEAETTGHRFWLAMRGEFTSEHNLGIERGEKQFNDFKEKLIQAQQTDAAKGTHEGLDLAIKKAAELDKQLAEMEKHRISDFTAFADDLAKGLLNANTRLGNTDKEIAAIRGQAQEAHALLKNQQDITEEHRKHLQLLHAQSAAQEEVGSKEIEKLKADTSAQLALASATAGSVAQQRLQQASGEADQLMSRILEEAHGRLTARIREEMTAIHALTAERQLARDAIATNQDLQKAITAIDQQIDSQKKLSQAYRESGDAVLAANVEAKLQPQIKAAADLREEYERLKQSAEDYADAIARLGDKWRIPMAPIPGIKGISSEALSVAKKNADEADARVEELRTKAIIEARQKYQTEIEQNDAAIQGEAPLLEALGAAYQQNAEAVRRAQVALALYHWEQAHPGADASQIEAVRVQLNQQSLEQRRNSDAELASRYSINFTYDETISKLQRAKEVMQEYGHDTLLIDAAIRDAQIEFLRQWDDAALKVGSFGDKFKAVMNEVAIQGKEASAKMAQAWLVAIDDINSETAKLLTGQQTDFKKIPQQLGEELTKAQLQKAEGAIAAHFGLKIPGLEGKPDGSDSNPLHVIIKNALPGSVPYGEGAPTSGGFGIGSFLSAIGFRAQGGPVMPGGDYIVGEQGPELLRIPHAGTIISNADMRSMSSVHRGGDTRSTHITQNFGPVTDGDMFKRTVRQENAKFFKHLK